MPTFSTVTRFYEQVGRRQVHKKPNELDTLDCVFIGPSSLASYTVPADLAIHPDFPSMVCIGWEIINREALIAEVRVSYSGKLTTHGVYYTEPEISTEWHETTLGWSTSIMQNTYPQYVDFRNPGPITVVTITINYLMKYTAKSISFRTLTNEKPAPGLNSLYSGQIDSWLGVLNEQFFINGFRQKKTDFAAKIGLTYQNDQVNHAVRYLDNGVWEETETYQTRAYIAYGN